MFYNLISYFLGQIWFNLTLFAPPPINQWKYLTTSIREMSLSVLWILWFLHDSHKTPSKKSKLNNTNDLISMLINRLKDVNIAQSSLVHIHTIDFLSRNYHVKRRYFLIIVEDCWSIICYIKSWRSAGWIHKEGLFLVFEKKKSVYIKFKNNGWQMNLSCTNVGWSTN